MVKEQLLRLLKEERGIYRSGEEVAERLGVSRAAVWKAAKALQKEGYAIEAVQGRGYCLAAGCDVLSAEGVKKFLHAQGLRIEAVPVAASTNAVVRERAERGEPAGLVYIAGEQTAGRGRLERSFYSPAGTGLYMSLLGGRRRLRGCRGGHGRSRRHQVGERRVRGRQKGVRHPHRGRL